MKNRFAFVFLMWVAVQPLFAQNWTSAENPAADYPTLRQAFYDFWEGKTPGKGQGYNVFKRWEWFWQSRVLPDGSFPPANIKEIEWGNYLAARPGKGGISAANWTSMGPNYSASGYNGIGRVNCIAVDPSAANTIWVGAPTGGLWKTENGGATWTTHTDQLTVLSVTAVAIDPLNPKVMYLGTGDGFGNFEPSIGILKSTDGGLTWNTTGLSWNLTNYRYIRHIVVHPTSTATVLAATSDGMYRTTNGGATWAKVSNGNFFDVRFKPGAPEVMYAATNNQVRKSINGGATWANVQTIPNSGRVVLAVTPAHKDMVVAASSSDASATYGSFNGLYVSTNSGSNFALKSSTPNLLDGSSTGSSDRGQGWYDFCVAVSPTDSNLIFVGGVNLWKSSDGGVSWSLATFWHNGAPSGVPVNHADKHALLWLDNVLYQGCDGGIYKTTDDGVSWEDISGNLAISQMYRLGVSQSDDKVICGLQDNGTKLRSHSGVWTDNIGGDGMECFIHPTNSNIMYGEYQSGNIRRSTNGGNSWTNIHQNVPGQPQGAWVTPFVMDPNISSTIYVGYRDVYKSTNQGNDWTSISSLNSVFDLQHIAVAPSNSAVIYVSDGDQVFLTTNGGDTWGNVTGNLPTNDGITYLTVDPHDANIAFVTFGGYTAGQKVFFTTTGGTTWANISGTLPNIPANCVLVQPNSKGVLYMGMDVGVFRRESGATDWELFNEGLPNVIITELEIRHSTGKIRASTYGRGLWESDLEPLQSCVPVSNLSAANAQPRAATLQWGTVNVALGYEVEWREVGETEWQLWQDVAGTSLTLTYLKPCTQYEFRVQAICGGETGGYSATQTFQTTGCSQYCNAYGSAAAVQGTLPQEWIESVSFGSIEQVSGNDWGYNDFTHLTTELLQGETFAIDLKPGFSDTAFAEAWAVWIDFNKDNQFGDDELVFAHSGSAGPVSGDITLPPVSLPGNVRMRVSMRRDEATSACDLFDFGEVEDYRLTIKKVVPEMTLVPAVVNFPADGGSQELVLTTNCDWSAANVPAWLTVTPPSGGADTVTLTIAAAANDSVAGRTVTLNFTGCNGQIVRNLVVTQNGATTSSADASSFTRNNVVCVPNPANESAWFLIQAVRMQTVRIELLGADGRVRTTLNNIAVNTGDNLVAWHPRDLPTGAYWFRCFFENEVVSGKVVVTH
ncbi:MAG: fibronectin type III domain-containing protein [Saprospiraceae bacterium]|nr:fibronectin type III domain-containing protein [Saprospiraceae bacterium]